jgi:hypothetical protein
VVISFPDLRSVGGWGTSSTGGSPSLISACGYASPSNTSQANLNRLRISFKGSVSGQLARPIAVAVNVM